MKLNLLFIAFALLTVCGTRSQDTTASAPADLRPVTFPFWMAREIALDLSEKEHLERLQALSIKETSLLRSLVSGQEATISQKTLQIKVLETQKQALEVSLKAERSKKPRDNLLNRIFQLAGAFGIGYFLATI